MTGNKGNKRKNKYKNYSSDSEFLQGVYQKIETLQEEEKEMEKIRSSRRRIWKKKLGFASLFLLMNLPFGLMLPEIITQNNQPLILGWSFLLMTMGSFFQYTFENRERY